MDLLGRFSINDFLVVLFPGLASGTGIAVIALATPLGPTLRTLDLGLAGGLVVLMLSYVLGVVLASHSRAIARFIHRRLGLGDSRAAVPKEVDSAAVSSIITQQFGDTGQWSTSTFYLARALVRECLPTSATEIERQNVLRQMRENLAICVFIWAVAGMAWLLHYERSLGAWLTILGISVVAIAAGDLAIALVRRMHQNGAREVREICCALIVGASTGALRVSPANPRMEPTARG